MHKKTKDWKWIDENGRSWSAEHVEHTFDAFIKKTIKRLVKDVVNQYIRQVAHFPVQPDDILAEVASVEMKSTMEMIEVQLDTTSLFLDDERLAEAIEKMKPWEKKLIELDFVFGCTEEDIAEYLNVERESVFTYRYRVLRKLERLMEATNGKREL